ncbi:MAG: DEAD/DEAH box helicase [Phycisphaerales bacterium]
MNVLEVHKRIVEDYEQYIRSFINIADPAIEEVVREELEKGKLWPEPLLQFNPGYRKSGVVADLVRDGALHRDLADIFAGYSLYRHQLEAIRLGVAGRDFVVTSGTGSGKSLTYIGTIFSHILANPGARGVAAVVVYPLNALINSQTEEFRKYQDNYKRQTGRDFPITFGQYTGQEDESARAALRDSPPQILLTNYMMLELLLTRMHERRIRDGIYENLRFLVFDELHTYRGRQGGDIAMLIRRIRAKCASDVVCIGTSATMVSGGLPEQQRQAVAGVAKTLFGKPFGPDQVVTEQLEYSLDHSGPVPSDGALAAAVRAGVEPSDDYGSLLRHPLALWLEAEAAIEQIGDDKVRRRPRPVGELASRLAEQTREPVEACSSALGGVLLWISRVNESRRRAGHRETVLPFRLHQFISQTGSVYTTLDQGADRFITLEPGIYKSDEENQKPIYPNVFSRSSGHAFICVSRHGDLLLPREFMEASEDDDQREDGYLIIGEDVWDPDSDLDALPDSWFRANKSGRKALPEKAEYFPQRIYFDELGRCSDSPPGKYQGWFMRAPLLFDPTSGTFFDPKTREGTKLAKLGSEGRSTSTTIAAFAILNQLREAGYPLSDQKLLSFTDNRQDAALQAGHFNDFVQVVRLRAGIHKALRDAPNGILTYARLGEAVFRALELPFADFSKLEKEPDLAPVRRRYEATFQNFLVYRALADLRRSWRIVLPNLEQCALLSIDYVDLDETAAADTFWKDTPLVSAMSASRRREFLGTILDFFRLEYALHSENFLEHSRMKENERDFREQLRAPWTLDEREDLRPPTVARLEPLARSAHLASVSVGPASSLGKFIKQAAKENGFDRSDFGGQRYRDLVLSLLERLADADYLHRLKARSEAGDEVDVYRLKVDKILWKLGDGRTVKSDVIKQRSFRATAQRPNAFFASMYAREFAKTKRLVAADHTGQLDAETRLDREDRFKCDWWLDAAKRTRDEARIRSQAVSALFCSPTMELGVDIGGLSVVHLRNAPPNSANYAQRAGRAGRSGQGALVFTYCSSFSPHDRHYFQHQAEMVAGEVQPPRIDLFNRELLQSHLHAMAVSEVGLPGLESQNGRAASLMSLVDPNGRDLPLSETTRAGLKLGPSAFASVLATFARAIHDFAHDLPRRGSGWFSDSWSQTVLEKLPDQLDRALGRWRKLHQSARTSLSRATQRIESGTLAASSDDYKKLVKLQNQATRQLNLLVNDLGKRTSDLSEFYPYRYLASEGFLPGYNFTRLPLRIFVPTGASAGEYISRPRAVALREFGPLNIIYHNGRKYRVDQLVVQDAEEALTEAKVSLKAGYFLSGEQVDLEICPFTGLNLSDNANKEPLLDLLEMGESRATEVDRISCEEEERASRGFEIDTYFSVDGSLDRIRAAVVKVADSPLLNLRYIPAARLVYVSRKWRATQFAGFPLALTTGLWRSSMPPQDEQTEPHRIVNLWTSNLADALYIEPVQPLALQPEGVITLQYALKRAIEAEFQVEPNEIGAVTIGDIEAPNILLYEAAEGSLGILSRFADDPQTLHAVVSRAVAICRFDDPEYKAPASYDDLLSYYNQRDHRSINRFSIRDALEKLSASQVEVRTNAGFRDYDDHYRSLLEAIDPTSSTERKFIDFLYANGLRLPDSAQKRTPGIYSQPDFYYEPRIWVFCDGSVHDRPEVQDADRRKRDEIRAAGDEVIVYYYADDLAELVSRRPDVFRRVR